MAAPIQVVAPSEASGTHLVVIGVDMKCTTHLSPFLFPSFTPPSAHDRRVVALRWTAAVNGVHSLDVEEVKAANGVILLFQEGNRESFDQLRRMSASLAPCLQKTQRLVLSVRDSSKNTDMEFDLAEEARNYCGLELSATFFQLDVADSQKTVETLQGFADLCYAGSRSGCLVRALYDNDCDNSFPFHTNDVFMSFPGAEADGWSLGNFLGFKFYFSQDYVVDCNVKRAHTDSAQRRVSAGAAPKLLNPHAVKSARVVAFRAMTDKNGKDFTAYVVQGQVQSTKWTVLRRFRQFVQLHSQAFKAYGKRLKQAPPFPSRTLRKVKSESALEERRAKLDTFLSFLIESASLRENYMQEKFVTRLINHFLQTELHVKPIPGVVESGPGQSGPPSQSNPAEVKTETETEAVSYRAPITREDTDTMPANPWEEDSGGGDVDDAPPGRPVPPPPGPDCPDAPPPPPPRPARPASTSTVQQFLSQIPSSEPDPPSESSCISANTKIIAVAQCASEAQDPSQLGFDSRDAIEFIREVDDEWAYGRLRGELGLFPKNRVKFARVPLSFNYDRMPADYVFEELKATLASVRERLERQT